MVKKLSLIMSAILLIVAMSTLTACVKNNKSLHDIWDMKLASDGQTVEVFGLTSKGEKQAVEGNGVFDFPTEVDGKTKFFFKAQKGYLLFNWDRYEKLTGIVFDERFKVENLAMQSFAGLPSFWMLFDGKQEQFLNTDVYAGRGIIFRQNERSDFDMPDWIFDNNGYLKNALIFKDDILDGNIVVVDGVYYGQMFDEVFESNEIVVPDGVTSIAYAGDAYLIYGRFTPIIEVVRVEARIERIQQGNVLGVDVKNGAARLDLKKVYMYPNTIIEKYAFGNVEFFDIDTGEKIIINNK
ncbi:MAG: hypothetical protein LBU60_05530 [Clostridiales bacterium]|jgi:hypothetical protein|nr:hypothetical protein [Clostridiales bacterium]